MRLPLLLYYIYQLVSEGHMWQYQNVTLTNKKPLFPFSIPQIIAILIAAISVWLNPKGIDTTTIDLLLSSLSILTGFLIAVAVIVYDKYKELPKNLTTDVEKIDFFKAYNFLRQYNALSMYAILLALVSIIMLLLNLLFGNNVDVSKFCLSHSIHTVDWSSTIVCISVLLFRFVLIYFIFDFFIITIYSICSLYSFINLQMSKSSFFIDKVNPQNVKSDYQTFKAKYSLRKTVAVAIVLLILGVMYLIFTLSGK